MFVFLPLWHTGLYHLWTLVLMNSSKWNIFRVTGPLRGVPLVTGEFLPQRPVARSFDVFFDLPLQQTVEQTMRRRWFETSWRSLWRHCNDLGNITMYWYFVYFSNLIWCKQLKSFYPSCPIPWLLMSLIARQWARASTAMDGIDIVFPIKS